ncbi:MAG TPA: hypothetical protein VFW76_14805 [Ktedonobacterales bacterium]|nr:hypothetical protein [Ktedonobacterales bacterium]
MHNYDNYDNNDISQTPAPDEPTSPQQHQTHQERPVHAWWRLVFGSRSGQARGFLRFWPLWEWLTLRVKPHHEIPNAPHHLFEVQFTHVDAKPITLPDGTYIKRRDPIAILHVNSRVLARIVNETTPWQQLRMMREDLQALARWVAAGGFPKDIHALYGYTLLGRSAPRLGFTLRRRPSTIRTRLDRFFLMGIIVLYHPGGRDRLAHGTTYETEPVETWMSLDELQRRYGSEHEY